jgi:serine/threonine-protein kinase
LPQQITAPPTVTTAPPAPEQHETVAPTQPTPQQPPAPPPPSPEAVREALSAKAADLPCSLVDVERDSGTMILQGIAGAGAPHQAIDQWVQTAGTPVRTNIQLFDDSYCPVLNAVVPLLRTSRLDFTATDSPGPVEDGMPFHPVIKNLPFNARLQVDYVTDGKVFHALPIAADKDLGMKSDLTNFFPAHSTLDLRKPPHNPLGAGAPFGTDMFLAVASSEKLFPTLRPQNENIAQYAAALKSAIERVQKAGGQVAVGTVLVTTENKH